MTNPAFRARYLADTVATASPAQLLVMLCDRLVLDLVHAENSLRAGDRETGASRLVHAQEIVDELRATLNPQGWDGAQQLNDIYAFVYTELVTANVQADPDRVALCRGLIEPICDAWRQICTSSMTAAIGGVA